jgi:hypothetical protein
VGKREGSVISSTSEGGSLQNELKGIAERDVEGRGRLEIADGREDIRSNDVARDDAAYLSIEMVMAERSVTGIVGGGTAFATGVAALAASV